MITKWLQIDKIKFANRRGRRPRRPVHTQTNSPINQNLKHSDSKGVRQYRTIMRQKCYKNTFNLYLNGEFYRALE